MKLIKSFIRRKILSGFKPGYNDMVIDVGSGDKPFWRADVFVDSLSQTDDQRATKSKTISAFGYFVDADAHKLPFKDKSFSFSFCSHLLEHVDDPAVVISEIERVSKNGYIEVPNAAIELIEPFAAHLWCIFLIDDTLVFYRKGEVLSDLTAQNFIGEKNVIKKFHQPFIEFYWQEKIKYKIIDNSEKPYIPKKSPRSDSGSRYGVKIYLLIFLLLRKLFYRRKK